MKTTVLNLARKGILGCLAALPILLSVSAVAEPRAVPRPLRTSDELIAPMPEMPAVARPALPDPILEMDARLDRRPATATAAVAAAAPAYVPERESLSDLSDEARQHRRSLEEFLEFQGPVRLRRPQASFTFDIPVSARMHVIAAEAEIQYSNSISLREDSSQLALFWDDAVLAQVPLMQKMPEGRIKESLPGVPFDRGYHSLRVDVAQHYGEAGVCEDPSSPTLWTQINPHESWIAMEYGMKPIEPLLSNLADLIDPRIWGDYELTIVTPRQVTAGADHLRWGGLVAQRAALMLDYKPLSVRHATEVLPTGDQVLIGTRNELSEILSREVIDTITDGFIGIYPNPYDPGYFLLVLSGADLNGVDRAVRAFALWNESLPAGPTMDVSGLDIPEMEAYQTDRTLVSNERVDFSELGFETATRVGMGAEPFKLEFSIPPDFYAPENATIEMKLHFAHGAALRSDSVLNVLLNGKFESAVYLKEEDGAVYRDYRISVPLRSLRPGRNLIEFEPLMNPIVSGHCEMIQEKNLLLTLFDDSELEMPVASHFVRLPDLQLWGWTGFPATVDPLGGGYTIHVAGRDSESMASAWMLSGKLAQIVGQPLVNLDVTSDIPDPGSHWIAVGTIGDISPDLLEAAPVQFGRNGRIPAILARVPGDRVGLREERRRVEGNQTSVLHGSNTAGEKGVVMQFQSPFDSQRTGMLVTAENRVTLQERVTELIQPGVWGGLNGDTMVWYGGDYGMRSQRLGDAFYLGRTDFRIAAAYQLSDHPWLGVGVAVLGVFLLAALARRALVKFQQRQHGTAPAAAGKASA